MAGLQLGELCLDPTERQAFYAEQLLPLTAIEYGLLELLSQNRERIFSQQMLLAQPGLFDELSTPETVRSHISSLRQKLKQAGAGDLVETVYGLGYRLKSGSIAPAADPVHLPEVDAQDAAKPEQAESLASSTPSPTPDFSQQLAIIWKRHQEKFQQRLNLVEQAITALEANALDEAMRRQAKLETHTMAGSLGSFGLAEATRLARQLEALFEQADLNSAQAEHLLQLFTSLRQELNHVPVEGTIATPAKTKHSRSRLLIVDDDLNLVEQLAKEATAHDMQVEIAANPTEARTLMQQVSDGLRSCPDVVLLDLNFANSAESGFRLLAELAQHHPAIPSVVLTAQESFGDRLRVARLGGKGFLQKSATPTQVLEAIAQVLQQSAMPEAKILVVDDDPQILDVLQTLLQPWGFQLTLISNPQHFWEAMEQTIPDLLILDFEMPDLTGIDLCQVIRNDPRWGNLPILFLSAHTDAATIQQVFTVGADDYVAKPIVGPELISRILNRLERTQILRKLAEIDSLTGVANRRKSNQDLTRLLHLAERQQQPLCLMVFDLDHFKQVNDRHGHDTGDQVLSHVGKLLKQSFRQEDVVARWGGEEFVVGLYGSTQEEGARRLIEVLQSLRQFCFRDSQQQQFQVTFSGGVAEYPKHGTDLKALYHTADIALYQAKAMGRNQVVRSP
jgi:diguanylate cyclase (GGDEF)-like protein